MKKIYAIMTLLLVAVVANAQIKYKPIVHLENDMDARTNYQVPDKSSGRAGDLCAIIKVVHSDMNFTFDIGSMVINKTEPHPEQGELWVYVPVGTNRIKIAHPKLGSLDTPDGFYWFEGGLKCQSGQVYRLRLETKFVADDDDIIKDASRFANLNFVTYPANAVVTLRKVPDETDEQGHLNKRMPLGTYHYRVSAPDYYDHDGVVELDTEGEAKTVNIRLKQAFGWLALSPSFDASGFSFSVDGKAVTASDVRRMKLSSGTHTVAMQHSKYRPYTQVVSVADSTVLDFVPEPVAIMGSLSVATNPAAATVKVDGKVIGTTPLPTAYALIIGEHTVEVSCPNYKTEARNVRITEGETTSLSISLANMARFSFESSPAGATLYVDGYRKGTTPCAFDIASGDYMVKLTRNGYHNYEKRMHLDSSSPKQTIRLSKQYQQKYSAYLQAAFQAGTLMAPAVSLGGYLYNVNIEATAAIGLTPSEDIYWMDTSDNSSTRPRVSNYKPLAVGGRLGYGFIIGSRLRVTPQVGGTWVQIKSSDASSTCISASVGVRAECVVLNHLGVSLTPEYAFAVKQSENFKKLADLSSKIKGWGAGFNVRVGVYVYL